MRRFVHRWTVTFFALTLAIDHRSVTHGPTVQPLVSSAPLAV